MHHSDTLRSVRSLMRVPLSNKDLVLRAFAMVLEDAFAHDAPGNRAFYGSRVAGGGATMWDDSTDTDGSSDEKTSAPSISHPHTMPMPFLSMRAVPPRSDEIIALVDRLVERTSSAAPSPFSKMHGLCGHLNADVEHVDGASGPHASRAWKRLSNFKEYENWASTIPRAVLKEVHRFATQHRDFEGPDKDVPVNSANAWMRSQGQLGGDHGDSREAQAPVAFHWLDLNMPCEFLPDFWKERKSMAVGREEGNLPTPTKRVLVVIDGADEYRCEVASVANDFFKKSKLVCILSTCRTALTVPVASTGPVKIVPLPCSESAFEGGQLLLNCAEKLVKVEGLSHMEAAELLVHSAPRKLMLNEMGVSPEEGRGCTFDDAICSLSKQPALQILEGHPSAIRHFARHLGEANTSDTPDVHDLTWCKLDQLRGVAQKCRESYDTGMAQALREAKKLLAHDEPSARIWANLTCNPAKEDEPFSCISWNAPRGLLTALEAELERLTSVPLVPDRNALDGLKRRILTKTDAIFLYSMLVRPPRRSRARDAETDIKCGRSLNYTEYVYNNDDVNISF